MIYRTRDPLGLTTVERESGRRYFATRDLARAVDQLCEWGVLEFENDQDVEAYTAIAAHFGYA